MISHCVMVHRPRPTESLETDSDWWGWAPPLAPILCRSRVEVAPRAGARLMESRGVEVLNYPLPLHFKLNVNLLTLECSVYLGGNNFWCITNGDLSPAFLVALFSKKVESFHRSNQFHFAVFEVTSAVL